MLGKLPRVLLEHCRLFRRLARCDWQYLMALYWPQHQLLLVSMEVELLVLLLVDFVGWPETRLFIIDLDFLLDASQIREHLLHVRKWLLWVSTFL